MHTQGKHANRYTINAALVIVEEPLYNQCLRHEEQQDKDCFFTNKINKQING